MATKKQISSLIVHSLNDDKEKFFETVEDIIKNNKNQDFVDKINWMISLSRYRRNESTAWIDLTLNPEKDYREYLYESCFSNYTLDDIILRENTKSKIKNWIKELKNLEFLSSYHLPLQTKALFFGDTGLWKTMTAHAIANEIWKPLLIVNLASIISSKLWETWKNLSFVFQVAQEKNAIIFLDEVDFIWLKRNWMQDHWEIRRSLLALIQILDLIPQNLVVIAATNMLDSLDSAIIRRFWLRIFFEKPWNFLIWKFLLKLSNQYSFSIDKSSQNKINKFLLWNNFHDIQTIILNAFKNKLLHEKKWWRRSIVLDFDDIKKYKYID